MERKVNPITVKEFKELYCLNRDDCFPCGDGCKKLSEALAMAKDKGFIKQTAFEKARIIREKFNNKCCWVDEMRNEAMKMASLYELTINDYHKILDKIFLLATAIKGQDQMVVININLGMIIDLIDDIRK